MNNHPHRSCALDTLLQKLLSGELKCGKLLVTYF